MQHDGILTVTKIFEFAYAHRLPSYAGKCVHPHGHTGKLEVEVAGLAQSTPYPGIVVDFHDLKAMLAPILDEVDHRCLDDLINAPAYAQWALAHLPRVRHENGSEVFAATAENMVLWVLHRLRTLYPHLDVRRLRWWESSTSCAEWRQA